MLSITNSKGRQVNLLNDESSKQQQKKRYHCTEPGCQKSFTTSGHLARHHRIHTGEKNFHCLYPGCPSRFSRQDNMMQHYRTHMSSRSRHHHYHYQYYQQQPLECQYSYYTNEKSSPLYSLKHTSRRGWSSFSSSSTDSSSSCSSGSPPPPPPLPPQYQQQSIKLPPVSNNKWIYHQPAYYQEYI